MLCTAGDEGALSRRRHALVLIAALAALAATGCTGAVIPGTEVEDTDDNRAIYEVVIAYRDAMQERDIDRDLAMTSPRYYENGGTTDTEADDYGYETLRDVVLPKLRENVKAVQFRVLLRRVMVDEERAWADYEYFYRFKFVEAGREAWDQKNDFNRLEFLREGTQWKIVSGL